MPKKDKELIRDPDVPFLTTIWGNKKYEGYVDFQMLTLLGQISNGIIKIANDRSLFSIESGFPLEVSYPPIDLAERITIKWLAELHKAQVKAKEGTLLKSYTFGLWATAKMSVTTVDGQTYTVGPIFASHTTPLAGKIYFPK